MNNPGRRSGMEMGWNNSRRRLSEEDIRGILLWTFGNLDTLHKGLKKDPSFIDFIVDLQMLAVWWSEPQRNIDNFYEQYPAARTSSFLDILNDAARTALLDETGERNIVHAKTSILTYSIFQQCKSHSIRRVLEIVCSLDFDYGQSGEERRELEECKTKVERMSEDENLEQSKAGSSNEEYLTFRALSEEEEDYLRVTLPWCHYGYLVTQSRVAMGRHILMSNMAKDTSNTKVFGAPHINITVSSNNGEAERAMYIKSLIDFKTLMMLINGTNSSKVMVRNITKQVSIFPKSSKDKSLAALGISDGNNLKIVEFDTSSSNTEQYQSGETKQNNQQQKKSSKSKKKKGNKQTKKKREPSQVEYASPPSSEEEAKRVHSKKLELLFDEARPTFKVLRQKLNELSLKRCEPKRREARSKKKKEKKADPQAVAAMKADAGTGGKPGKIMFPILVGNITSLYKSNKKKRQAQQNQSVLTVDLHSCTREGALKYLDNALPGWYDTAMTGTQSYVVAINIVCGGGKQVLSEAVEKWIKTSSQVANRPKSFG